jgi:hypothetical protein
VLLREVSVPTTADTIDEINETFTIASGTASATGTINDDETMSLLWQRSLRLRLLKDLMCIQLYTKAILLLSIDYIFVFTNGTAGSGLHYYNVTVTVPAGATTGTVSVPTTADTIDCRTNETFTIASGTASATGTINDNDNEPTVERSLLLRLLKDPAVIQLYASNPSAIDDYTFTFLMELLKC